MASAMFYLEESHRIRMRSLIRSITNHGLKSVLLGTNEESFRLSNEFREFVFPTVQRARYLQPNRFTLRDALWEFSYLEFLLKITMLVDRVITTAEKNAQLREVLEEFTHLIVLVLEDSCLDFPKSVASGLESAYNVVVSAIVLLSLVYQYLIGSVDKGGSKTYSSGSFEFRDTFVSIVLFRGAYVWIKFRQACYPGSRRKRKSCETPDHASQFGDESHFNEGELEGVYRRAMKDKWGTITHYKYEPRFKPPRERLDSGTTLKFNCLSLGQYNTYPEARIVRQIAAFLYGKGEGSVQLEDGHCFSVPFVTEQEKCPLSGKEKAEWVTRKTKEVYADLLKQKARQSVQLQNTTMQTNSHFVDARNSDPTPSAEIETFPALATNNCKLTVFPDGEPSLAAVQFDMSADFSDCEDMMEELRSLLANGPPPQSSVLDNQMHNGGVTEIVAHPSPPQVDGAAAQGLESIAPLQLMSPEMDSLRGQVNHLQQLVTRQKKQMEDFAVKSAIRNVELQHQLMESEVQKSELQRENERLRTMLQQVPISQVATWSCFITGTDMQ